MAAAALSSWFCSNSAKANLVRIVHPGGHIELHDGPVRAAEIMLRNPRFCLTHSRSSHHPCAIVSPDTTLMVGRKYYLFPENAVGNFQRRPLLPPQSPSMTMENRDLESDCLNGGKCMMCFVSKEKGSERIVKSEIGISCRERSEECGGGEDLVVVNRVNRRGAFLQNGNIRRSSRRLTPSSSHWQPSLSSISEDEEY